MQVPIKLILGLIVEALRRPDGAVPTLGPAVGSEVGRLGGAVFDAVFGAHAVKKVAPYALCKEAQPVPSAAILPPASSWLTRVPPGESYST